MTTHVPWVEIACDESGFSGTNLLDPASPVLTHASVDLTLHEAGQVVAVLGPVLGGWSEHRSSRLLRPEHAAALEWFLGALAGRAHVVVVDKPGFVAARVLELFTEDPSYGAGTRLGSDHSRAVRTLRRRTTFLASFVALVRTARRRPVDDHAIGRFLATMPTDEPGLAPVTPVRVRDAMRRLVDGDPVLPPPLEPLVPALAETLLHWSAGGRSVAVVHDEQSALTAGRVSRLGAFLADAVAPDPPPLRSFVHVDSRTDPRVQVADLFAGVARRRAQQDLSTYPSVPGVRSSRSRRIVDAG
ncbi:hypothetical protein Cch01nite_09670 [Cellulomonas chitinilytica]|uniref:DUF3800 domain-containing protein n=1 Tax=Cellulomonas chitinilytica TaxID=398759 RepID=A0A919TYY2_9CELL|nr:hypothetical protein [Cellulomonas chitinilytica]GIG20243.1 hypothetical protein Cch01nite_09670 [Cellulomonas chitinilytica]